MSASESARTNYHNWYLPAKGEDNWAVARNNAISEIDSKVHGFNPSGTALTIEEFQGSSATFGNATINGTLDAGSISIGGGTSVNGVHGGSGDYIQLGQQRLGTWSAQTTSVSYTNVSTYGGSCLFPTTQMDIAGIGKYHIGWFGGLANYDSSTADVSARLAIGNDSTSLTSTSVTKTPNGFMEFGEITSATDVMAYDPLKVEFELQTTAGTGELIAPTVTIYGEIA